ncbi:type I restriction enzyme HsdR N-terminal domain-containing protein [Bacteroides sp.]|uniref:type I restriction enzyme HsdR N-terminal domain-containing protein n=1 Tax=Bacteroides sp. TaxID=29523 RepID=UPI0025BB3C30|nr:type I restriction enzyme HsdR N-terminal domain-containing protein [Bacteroides sp.]
MKFNTYTWNLYKQTIIGEKTIKYFSNAGGYDLFKKYCPHSCFIPEDLYNDWLEDIYCYGVSDYDKPVSLDEAKELYVSLITLGIRVEEQQWFPANDFKNILEIIQPMSYILSQFAPEYFFPYLFLCRIFELNKIADFFGIDLPNIPKRTDYKGRCMYYWELCEVFHQFRKENGLSPEELWAFLHDFAPQNLPNEKIEIPKPSQAWFIGGHTEKEEMELDSTFWQANPDTKKGDTLVHYETSPVSAITCVKTSFTDGVIDPLFRYYGCIYIGNRIDIPRITLKEFQEDKYFSSHPLIKKNFQGVNGWPMSSEDYSELIRMIKAKGFDTDTLPELYVLSLPKNVNIDIEKDVEQQLLEPLLNSMGWYENKDFIRQLPIQAGRGHRIFPDYALHYGNKSNEERAKVLIEAKLYMRNNKEREEAYLQARSYARLLNSSVIVLCDKDYLIVYEKKDSFDRDRYKKYYWGELENPSLFNELKNKLK